MAAAADAAENDADDVVAVGYDEDLAANPFFRALQSKHPRLFGRVGRGWAICVPCAPSLRGLALTADHFETHVLRPLASHADVRGAAAPPLFFYFLG